jgi:hypothetical protein
VDKVVSLGSVPAVCCWEIPHSQLESGVALLLPPSKIGNKGKNLSDWARQKRVEGNVCPHDGRLENKGHLQWGICLEVYLYFQAPARSTDLDSGSKHHFMAFLPPIPDSSSYLQERPTFPLINHQPERACFQMTCMGLGHCLLWQMALILSWPDSESRKLWKVSSKTA